MESRQNQQHTKGPPLWKRVLEAVSEHIAAVVVTAVGGIIAIVVAALLFAFCHAITGGGETPTPTPRTSPLASPAPETTVTLSPISTREPSSTPVPKHTPTPTPAPTATQPDCREERVALPNLVQGEVLLFTGDHDEPLRQGPSWAAQTVPVPVRPGSQMFVIDPEVRFDENTCDGFLNVVAQLKGDPLATAWPGWIHVTAANVSHGGCRQSGGYRAGDWVVATDDNVRLRRAPSPQETLPDGRANPFAQLLAAGQQSLLVVDPGPQNQGSDNPWQIPFIRVVVVDDKRQPAEYLFNPQAPDPYRQVKQPREGCWVYQLYVTCASP